MSKTNNEKFEYRTNHLNTTGYAQYWMNIMITGTAAEMIMGKEPFKGLEFEGHKVVAWCQLQVPPYNYDTFNHPVTESPVVDHIIPLFKDYKGYFIPFLIDYVLPVEEEQRYAWERDGMKGQTTILEYRISQEQSEKYGLIGSNAYNVLDFKRIG